MVRTLKLVAVLLVASGLGLATVGDADARRLGGARTLGGKSSLQRSARPPRTPAQQAAFNKNQQARQQLAQRGGLMGLLGGLAIGGLLGALFFGGAFENLNLLDFLLFGAVAFLLLRFLGARQRAQMHRRSAGTDAGSPAAAALGGAAAPFSSGAEAAEHTRPAPRPPGFDERAFLAGARRAFEALQKAWNDRELAELRGLTTDSMFAELQDQLREPDADAFVEVLKVDAELLDVRDVDGHEEATVLFDSVLRETVADRPAQVREIWHFTRRGGASSPTWFLDGIEQMQD